MAVYYVRPVPEGGGWYIAPEGSPFAVQMFWHRQDAIREARKLRGRERGEVRIYGFDGRYSYSDTAPWLGE